MERVLETVQPVQGMDAGRCSKVVLHMLGWDPQDTLTRDIAHLGKYFPILCFYLP